MNFNIKDQHLFIKHPNLQTVYNFKDLSKTKINNVMNSYTLVKCNIKFDTLTKKLNL